MSKKNASIFAISGGLITLIGYILSLVVRCKEADRGRTALISSKITQAVIYYVPFILLSAALFVCLFRIIKGKSGASSTIWFAAIYLLMNSLPNILYRFSSLSFASGHAPQFRSGIPETLRITLLIVLLVLLYVGSLKDFFEPAKLAAFALTAVTGIQAVMIIISWAKSLSKYSFNIKALEILPLIGEALLLLSLAFVLMAVGSGNIEGSSPQEKTKVHLFSAIIIVIILILFIGIRLASCSSDNTSNSSGRGPGSTCMVDGCNNKAVGPTYEFCAKHKRALDDYWNWEAQNS